MFQLCILTLYSWHQYESALAIKVATWCIHVFSMYFQLISLLHLFVVDIFTQLMQKDSLEKLGGKPKSITHLNWSRSLINVVPIQTESCLKTTTFVDINYHVRVDFLWNRWKTMHG